jgi:hypothetical protein
MKWPFSKSSQSGASDLPPETRRQYERLYEILHNEALQNEPYPESLKSRMSAGSDTDQNPDGFGYFTPFISSDYAACLDFSVAKKGFLTAYRWSGESVLLPNNIVYVNAEL